MQHRVDGDRELTRVAVAAVLRESLPKTAKRKRYCGFVFDSLRHLVRLCGGL